MISTFCHLAVFKHKNVRAGQIPFAGAYPNTELDIFYSHSYSNNRVSAYMIWSFVDSNSRIGYSLWITSI